MSYEAIKGAKEFVEELQEPLKEIESDIKELKKRRDELLEKLDKGESRFKLAALKKNKDIQSELSLIERTLEDAEQEKERIIESYMKSTFSKAQKIISAYKKEILNTKKAENAEMIKKIYEIRAIFNNLFEEEKKVAQTIESFIQDIKPFVSDEDGSYGGVSYLFMLEKMADTSTISGGQLRMFDTFREGDYGIQGLLALGRKVGQREKESNEKYGVNI